MRLDLPAIRDRAAHNKKYGTVAIGPLTDITALLAEVERLTALLDRVRAIHQPEECCCGEKNCDETKRGCVCCFNYYPCPTIRALDGVD